MSDIALTASQRSSLLSLQNTSDLSGRTQGRLSTGLKVSSVVDDAIAFFSSKALSDRASDFTERKDGIDQGISSIQSALLGTEAIDNLLLQLIGISNAAASQSDAERAASTTQFKSVLNQIHQLTEDSSYQGLNLLNSTISRLDVSFGVRTESRLSVQGYDLTATSASNSRALFEGKAAVTEGADTTQEVTVGTPVSGQTATAAVQQVVEITGLNDDPETSDQSITFTFTQGADTATFIATLGTAQTSVADKISKIETDFLGSAGDDVRSLISGASLATTATALQFGGASDGSAFSISVTSPEETSFDAPSTTTTGAAAVAASPASQDFTFGGTIEEGDVFTATAGNSTFSYTATAADTDASTLAASFVAAFNADTANTSDFNTSALAVDGTVSSRIVFTGPTDGSPITAITLTATNRQAADGQSVYDANGVGSISNIASGFGGSAFSTIGDGSTGTSAADRVQELVNGLQDARSKLRSFTAELGGNVAILNTRLDFTNKYVNELQQGSDKLTLADLNEEGANLSALQTRQQLGIQSLSIAGQQQQAILTLIR